MDLSPLLSKLATQRRLSTSSLSVTDRLARTSSHTAARWTFKLQNPSASRSFVKQRLSELFERLRSRSSSCPGFGCRPTRKNSGPSSPLTAFSSASVTSFFETANQFDFSMEGWQIFLIAFGSYLTASVFFHFFPTLLHKKKNVFTARNISHRGGAGERPENTLAAFHHAIAVGSEMLELDVYLTADGQVVVNHDRVLTRTTGKSLDVTLVPYDELPKLIDNMILPPPFHPSDPPSSLQWNKERAQDDLTHIPLLEDVFKEFPNTPINIDCKVDSAELCQRVNELVVKYNRAHLTCWGAFADVNCQRLYKLNPSVPILFSFKRIAILYLSYIFGVLPFIPLKESFYEMPLITPKLEALFRQYNRSYHGWKVETALSLYKFISTRTSLIRHLQRRGIRVFFWVLNHEEDWEIAFRLGADGVMTDFPTRLSRFLQNYGRESRRSSPQDRLLRNQ